MKPHARMLLVLAVVLALVPTTLVVWSVLTVEPLAGPVDLRPAAWHPTRTSRAEAPAEEVLREPQVLDPDSAGGTVARLAPPSSSPPSSTEGRPRASVPSARRRAQAERLIREQAQARARRLAAAAGVEGREEVLAQVLLDQRARFEDLHTMLAGLPTQDRKRALRTSNREFRGWYDDELATNFGADAVAVIQRPFAAADPAPARK